VHHHLLPPVYSKMMWMRAPAITYSVKCGRPVPTLDRVMIIARFMIPITIASMRTVLTGLCILM